MFGFDYRGINSKGTNIRYGMVQLVTLFESDIGFGFYGAKKYYRVNYMFSTITDHEIMNHFMRIYPEKKINPQLDRIKTCGMKKGYATEEQVMNLAKGRTKYKVRAYKCPFCNLFHASTHQFGEKI